MKITRTWQPKFRIPEKKWKGSVREKNQCALKEEISAFRTVLALIGGYLWSFQDANTLVSPHRQSRSRERNQSHDQLQGCQNIHTAPTALNSTVQTRQPHTGRALILNNKKTPQRVAMQFPAPSYPVKRVAYLLQHTRIRAQWVVQFRYPESIPQSEQQVLTSV